MKPFAARSWTRRHGLIFSAVAVTLANIYPLFGIGRRSEFDWRSYRCNYSSFEGVWLWLGPVLLGIFLLFPNVIVIITTLALLYKVKKATGVHRRAVMTLVPISAIYLISYAPIGIYWVAESTFQQGDHYLTLNRFGSTVKFLNNSLNPLVYLISLRSFRKFVKRLCGKCDCSKQVAQDTMVDSKSLSPDIRVMHRDV